MERKLVWFDNEEVKKDPQTTEKYMTVNISNTSVKIINTALNQMDESEKFDRDDTRYVVNFKDTKDGIHEIWKLLNPS